MSKNLMSMPVGSALMQTPTQIALPWQKYLKALGDDALTANKLVNSVDNSAFKYTINGNICFYTYYTATPSDSDITITLPYRALFAFDIDGAIYATGTKSIIIPALKNYLQGWYFIDFTNI